jgi:hypothetical protein
MRNPHIAWQGTHISRTKNVAHQPWPLVHMEGITLRSGNPGCVLSAMLKHH